MSGTSDPTDPTRCPLCGQDNRCVMERERDTGQTQDPCWCVTERFDPALMDSLPSAAQGKTCICSSCLQNFKRAADNPTAG